MIDFDRNLSPAEVAEILGNRPVGKNPRKRFASMDKEPKAVELMKLCRMGFLAGIAAMFLSCCMMDMPVWTIAVSGIGGGVLALACSGGTGWCE